MQPLRAALLDDVHVRPRHREAGRAAAGRAQGRSAPHPVTPMQPGSPFRLLLPVDDDDEDEDPDEEDEENGEEDEDDEDGEVWQVRLT